MSDTIETIQKVPDDLASKRAGVVVAESRALDEEHQRISYSAVAEDESKAKRGLAHCVAAERRRPCCHRSLQPSCRRAT
jgi:hypothetical protein